MIATLQGPWLPPGVTWRAPGFFGDAEAWSAALWLHFRPWDDGAREPFRHWCAEGVAAGDEWLWPAGSASTMSIPMPRPVYREVQRRAAFHNRSVGAETTVCLLAGLSQDADVDDPLEIAARYFVPLTVRKMRLQAKFRRWSKVTVGLGAYGQLARVALRIKCDLDIAFGAVMLRGFMRIGTGIVIDTPGEAIRASDRRVAYRMEKVAAAVRNAPLASDLPAVSNDQTAEIEEEMAYIRWVHEHWAQRRRDWRSASA